MFVDKQGVCLICQRQECRENECIAGTGATCPHCGGPRRLNTVCPCAAAMGIELSRKLNAAIARGEGLA